MAMCWRCWRWRFCRLPHPRLRRELRRQRHALRRCQRHCRAAAQGQAGAADARAEIATLALPVFVTVMLFVAVLPTVTLPKLTLAGFTDKLEVAATPVPLSANAAVDVVALLAAHRHAAGGRPALFGANCT